MAQKTDDELKTRIKILEKDEQTFTEFLRDTYGDKQCSHKISQHLWRIKKEIEIIRWVLNEELPF